MISCHRLVAFVLALGAAGGALAATDAVVEPASAAMVAEPRVRDPSHADALAQCEKAVDESIHQIRGKQVADLQFSGSDHAVSSEGDHLSVKGAGRYRRGTGAPIEFHYSCAFDEASGATSGVLFHEADNAPPPALPVWQADLTKLSPEACETAAAEQLQSSHPRASGIVFDGDARKLEPGSEGRTALSGTGRLVRAPGMQPNAFRYRCEFDGAGHLANARASD